MSDHTVTNNELMKGNMGLIDDINKQRDSNKILKLRVQSDMGELRRAYQVMGAKADKTDRTRETKAMKGLFEDTESQQQPEDLTALLYRNRQRLLALRAAVADLEARKRSVFAVPREILPPIESSLAPTAPVVPVPVSTDRRASNVFVTSTVPPITTVRLSMSGNQSANVGNANGSANGSERHRKNEDETDETEEIEEKSEINDQSTLSFIPDGEEAKVTEQRRGSHKEGKESGKESEKEIGKGSEKGSGKGRKDSGSKILDDSFDEIELARMTEGRPFTADDEAVRAVPTDHGEGHEEGVGQEGQGLEGVDRQGAGQSTDDHQETLEKEGKEDEHGTESKSHSRKEKDEESKEEGVNEEKDLETVEAPQGGVEADPGSQDS